MKIVATSSGTGFGPTAALGCFLDWAADVPELKVELEVPADAMVVLRDRIRHRWRIRSRTNSSSTELRTAVHDAVLLNFGRPELLYVDAIWRHHFFVDCANWLNSRPVERLKWRSKRTTPLFEHFPPIPSPALGGETIGPCIARTPVDSPIGDHIVVTFGGGIFPGTTSACPLSRIIPRLEFLRDRARLPYRFIYTGGGGRLFTGQEHRHLIATARVVVTVPGLYAVFEALQSGRPIVFLPPTNYTQLVQYTWYRDSGLVPPTADWFTTCGMTPTGANAIGIRAEAEFTDRLRSRLATPDVLCTIADRVFETICDALADGPSTAANSVAATYIHTKITTLEAVLDGINT